MLTVYIWDEPGDNAGHAAMKITRIAHTRFYSWWPSGSSTSVIDPTGAAGPDSQGYKHPRKNPISSGNSKLDPTKAGAYRDYAGKVREYVAPGAKPARQVDGGDHNPGGPYGYNRSDKDMEGGSATDKFFFRPSSGLNVAAAEALWQTHLNKSKDEGSYHFLRNNCSTLVLKALEKAVEDMPDGAGKKFPRHKGLIVSPNSLKSYCIDLANVINNDLLRWSPPPREGFVMGRRGAVPPVADLPPVIMALGKAEGARYVDPNNGRAPVNFSQKARHEPHA